MPRGISNFYHINADKVRSPASMIQFEIYDHDKTLDDDEIQAMVKTFMNFKCPKFKK